MSVQSIVARHQAEDRYSLFARDMIDGLTARPKRLSPKYFYDETGSRLFEQITELPEYYPTRCELASLRAHAADMAGLFPIEDSGLASGYAGPWAGRPHRTVTTRSVPTSLVSSLKDSSVMMSDPPVHSRSEMRAKTSAGSSTRSRA